MVVKFVSDALPDASLISCYETSRRSCDAIIWALLERSGARTVVPVRRWSAWCKADILYSTVTDQSDLPTSHEMGRRGHQVLDHSG